MGMTAGEYQPSGKMGKALLVVPLIVIPVVLVLAFIYGYVCVHNPLAGILSFLIPLGYGFAIAYTLCAAGKLAHCRSNSLMWAASALCAVAAIYMAWASFLSVLLKQGAPAGTLMPGMLEIMACPAEMWDIMGLVNASGWFTVKRLTPSGIVLWIFWILEAGIIGGLIGLVPTLMLKSCVYCETCGCWATEKKDIARFAEPASRELAERIKGGDILALAELGNDPGGLKPCLRLDTQRCGKCSETATFQVVQIRRSMDEGKKQEKEDDWTGHVLLNAASLQAFQEAMVRRTQTLLAEKQPQPAAVPPASAE